MNEEQPQEQPQEQQFYTEQPSSDFYLQTQQEANLTKWQLTTSDLFDDLEHDLRGEVWNDKKKKFVVAGVQLVNEEGIRTIISVLSSRVNKNTYLSNLSYEIIYEITTNVALTLVTLFECKFDKFKIKPEDLEMLHDKIIDFIFIALMRAYEQGERRFLAKSERRFETIIRRPEDEKKGGFLGGLFGR